MSDLFELLKMQGLQKHEEWQDFVHNSYTQLVCTYDTPLTSVHPSGGAFCFVSHVQIVRARPLRGEAQMAEF